jgi:hypothetical protein
MSNAFFLKLVNKDNYGLCNQLLSLVSGILYCIRNKKELLVIDKFLTEINTNNYCSISQIFNLIEMNNYLQKYNLKIVDGFNIKSSAFIPISWDVITLAKKHDNKKLLAFIDEIYNNIYFSKCLHEYAVNYICEKVIGNPNNITHTNEPTEPTEPSDTNKKIKQIINVIHLRIEDDGIEHWSKQNNMNPIIFKKMLLTKYIELIKNNIQQTDTTLVLSADTNNDIVQFMRENGYNIMFVDKKFKQHQNARELNAIIDLIIGKCCNNVFIGCNGSTFSELLLKYIPDISENGNVQKITFDLNNLRG